MASEIKVDTISEKTSANGVTIDGVNIKDSALATAGSVPLSTIDIDGGTDIGAAIVDADLFIVDDGAGGTNRKVAASRLKTYAGTTINNATANEIVTIGSTTTELDAEANLTFDGSTLTCIGAVNVGVDDAGHDVKFFGNTTAQYVMWDASEDDFVAADAVKLACGNSTDVFMLHDGTNSVLENATGNLTIDNAASDADIIFKGTDGGSDITALSLDMSDNGGAYFKDDIYCYDDKGLVLGTDKDFIFCHRNGEGSVNIYVGAEGNGKGTNEGQVAITVGDSAGSIFTLEGGEGGSAQINLYADQADDNGDYNRIYAHASGGVFFGNHTDGAWDDEFKISDDAVTTEHSISTATVDYAEFFEWKTELASDARITETYGLTVVLDNDKVRLAEAGEEANVIGVVRPNGTSSFVGGNGLYWHGRKIKNVWGEEERENYTIVNWHNLGENGRSERSYSFMKDRIPQYEIINNPKNDVPNWHLLDSNFKRGEDGNKIPIVVPSTDEEKAAHRYTERTTHRVTGKPLTRRIFNSDYDPNLTYVDRKERRKEWCIVGLVGQVPIRDTAIIPTTWTKMKTLESGIDLYYIK